QIAELSNQLLLDIRLDEFIDKAIEHDAAVDKQESFRSDFQQTVSVRIVIWKESPVMQLGENRYAFELAVAQHFLHVQVIVGERDGFGGLPNNHPQQQVIREGRRCATHGSVRINNSPISYWSGDLLINSPFP